MYLNLTSTPKIAPKGKKNRPKGPKKVRKRLQIWMFLKQKIGLYFQNQSGVKYQGFESSIKHEFECIKRGTDSIDEENGHYTREGESQFIKIKNTVI